MILTTGSDDKLLISRRAVPGRAVVLAAAGTTTAETADQLTRAGEIVTPYGMSATTDITRVPIQPHPDLAPELSFSGTPLHKLRGTITPSDLYFEVQRGGRPLIDASKHELVIHSLVDNPIRLNRTAHECYGALGCQSRSSAVKLGDEGPENLDHGATAVIPCLSRQRTPALPAGARRGSR